MSFSARFGESAAPAVAHKQFILELTLIAYVVFAESLHAFLLIMLANVVTIQEYKTDKYTKQMTYTC